MLWVKYREWAEQLSCCPLLRLSGVEDYDYDLHSISTDRIALL